MSGRPAEAADPPADVADEPGGPVGAEVATRPARPEDASLFGERWPGPDGPAPRPVVGLVTVAGIGTALAVPTGPVGLGWPLTALTLVAATLLGRRYAAAARPVLAADVGWAVAAVALAAVPAVRAADWLAALCLLAAVGAAALAVAGRSFPSLVANLALPPVAGLRAVPWLARGVRGGVASPARVVGVALASAAVLLVFVPLLASADAAFARVVSAITPVVEVDDDVVRTVVLFGVGVLATGAALFLLFAPPEPVGPTWRPTRLRLLDWALPVGLLVGVFLLFVVVQSVVLFGSDAHVLATTGLTYAEYARSGFWQLLAVTALALGVLALGSRWAPVSTPAERGAKRGLLAALAVLTLVLVGSALHRMWLYQQAYGFTVLRVLVLTVELWLGAGFLIALVAVLRLRPAGLSRPMVAAGVAALLGLALLDPERFIAEHNAARFGETGRLDADYLATLSADAVPALLRLPEPARSCTLVVIAADLREPDGLRGANASRAAARTLLGDATPACPDPPR